MKVWAVLRQGVLLRLTDDEADAHKFVTDHNAFFKHAAPCIALKWPVVTADSRDDS